MTASILVVASIVAIVYVLLAAYAGLVRLASSLLQLASYAETMQNSPHERQYDSESMMPVSILLPECDIDPDVVATVRGLLALEYPEYEIIAITNSARGKATQKLEAAFNMAAIQQPIKRSVRMQPVRQVLRSASYPGLVVIDKNAGGRHDALNAGINASRYPLVVSLSAGARMDKNALVQLATPFMKSFHVVAVGALPRVSAAAKGPLAALSQVELLRAYPAGLSVPGRKKLPLVPGAFGAFRKKVLIEEGGFTKGGNETEMAVRLYRRRSEKDKPYQIDLLSDPVIQNMPPKGIGGWFRQLWARQRELLGALVRNKRMILNPSYGRAGLFDIPGKWLFDVLGPFLEVLGCVLVSVGAGLGFISWDMFWLFWAAEVLFGIVLSLAAVMSQSIVGSDKPSFGELVKLVFSAVLGNIGYRQISQLFRMIGTLIPRRDVL